MLCGLWSRRSSRSRGGDLEAAPGKNSASSSSTTLSDPVPARIVSNVEKQSMAQSAGKTVEFVILGPGWTSIFLIPALKDDGISYSATSTTGHDDTIPFRFNPDSANKEQFEVLPNSKTILITFPLKGTGQAKLITQLYHDSHPKSQPQWI